VKAATRKLKTDQVKIEEILKEVTTESEKINYLKYPRLVRTRTANQYLLLIEITPGQENMQNVNRENLLSVQINNHSKIMSLSTPNLPLLAVYFRT